MNLPTHVAKKVAIVPKTFFLLKDIKSMAKDFEKNNFNVK